MGHAVFPPCNEDNGNLLQRSQAHTATLSASDPEVGHRGLKCKSKKSRDTWSNR